jgi:hypothetical protein
MQKVISKMFYYGNFNPNYTIAYLKTDQLSY